MKVAISLNEHLRTWNTCKEHILNTFSDFYGAENINWYISIWSSSTSAPEEISESCGRLKEKHSGITSLVTKPTRRNGEKQRKAAMLKVVPTKPESRKDFELSLDEIAREVARRLLVKALDLEVEEDIKQPAEEKDETGHRLVVRNGVGKSRTVTIGSGRIDIQAPRVDDHRDGEKFFSSILPPYLRKSPKVESLLPLLYLKGLSTNNFKSALAEFLGDGTLGLIPASIVKLKRIWESEFAVWEKRQITKNMFIFGPTA